MKITFDWKNFDTEKPEQGKTLICFPSIPSSSQIQFTTSHKNDKFIICEYLGLQKDGKTHLFSGYEVNVKTLKREKGLAYPIYDKTGYTKKYNPHDFLWDYWEEKWF